MTACAECGTDSPAGSKFCFSCGQSLEATCPECHQPLPMPDAKFCPSCGARVGAEAVDEQMLKPVSILFADVVSSTARAEAMHAEDVRDLMSNFFEAMTAEIRSEGGRIEKFIGDAVMAVFGVPTAREDDPLRAVRAARKMLSRLEVWNEGREELHQIKLRIGVNTGEVLAAAPGADLVVTGDTVNVAARFEQSAEAGTIVVGERTARAVRSHFIAEPIEPLVLKGKSEPMPAFLIADAREVPQERGVPGLQAPMIGRDSELGTLVAALEATQADGKPNLVTVVAEPGVGKSRLLREFTIRAGKQARFTIGRCLPYGEGVTLWPLGEILKAEAGILDNDPAELALEKVVKFVRAIPDDLTADRDRTVAGLATTIGLTDQLDPLKALDPRERLQELLNAWVALLTSMSAESRLVVVIEDIHWADPTMLEVLDGLLARLHGQILIVCPTRPELFVRHPEWGEEAERKRVITLGPLDPDHSAALVEALLGAAEIPVRLRERILDRAEGNPFFIEELLHRLIDEQILTEIDGTWTAAAESAEIEIPDNVQGVILARIDLLPTPTKHVIQHAAVVGRAFWPGALESIGHSGDLQAILRDLEDRQLILQQISSSMAGEAEYLFKHVLIKDVAYDTMPRKRRGKAHVATASWIADVSGNRVDELAELLAHHYHRAFEFGKDDEHRKHARQKYAVAAHGAARRFAIQQAQSFGQRAVELASDDERVPSLEGLGDLHMQVHAMDEAFESYKRALDEAGAKLDEDSRARLSGKAAIVPTRYEAVMKESVSSDEIDGIVSAGLKMARPDTRERALLLVAKANMQISGYQEMDRGGEEAAREALEIARRLEDPDLMSAALDVVSCWSMPTGVHGRVHDLSRERVEIVPRLSDVGEACDAYVSAAWSAILVGRYADGERFASQCVARAEGIDPGSFLEGLLNRVLARFMTGDWDGAMADQAVIQRLEVEQGREVPAPHMWAATAVAATIAGLRGSLGDVHSYVGPLVERIEGDEALVARLPWFLALVARAFARVGDSQTAFEYLSIEPGAMRCVHLEVLADTIGDAGDWRRAQEIVELATAESERCELQALPAFAERLMGRAAAGRHDVDTACSDLARSAGVFAELQAPWEEAYSLLLMAEASAQNGSVPAREPLERAHAVFMELGSSREAERAQRLL